MTMFTRNDKAADANAASAAPAAPARERSDIQPPPVAPVEPRRPQAAAQPLAVTAPAPAQNSVSVISKALKITGQLESTEDIQIDGEVEGDVRGVSVSVGSHAKVKGTVYGERVELAGTVEGKIEAKRVVLTRTAHMAGDVIHQDITIESGAFIDGHCRPQTAKPESKSTASPKPASPAREVATTERANGTGTEARA